LVRVVVVDVAAYATLIVLAAHRRDRVETDGPLSIPTDRSTSLAEPSARDAGERDAMGDR
jgi:hypothetical protein